MERKTIDKCIAWLRKYFEDAGSPKAVIGISGGKDSTVVAYLCVEALGKDNVVGVLMPNDEQADIADSYEVVNALSIQHITLDISASYNGLVYQFEDKANKPVSKNAKVNLAPRIRMAALYMVAQTVGGRVVGTGNLCESILGYYTLWGDGVCDVNPIANMLVSEVVELGEALGVPGHLVHKAPSDGLTGKTDEESFGFTYRDAEACILHDWNAVSEDAKAKIEKKIDAALWKWNIRPHIPCFDDWDLKWHSKSR